MVSIIRLEWEKYELLQMVLYKDVYYLSTWHEHLALLEQSSSTEEFDCFSTSVK